MSFNVTSDNIVYAQTTQPENIAEKPFIQKSWTNPIFDTNTSANYSSNQIIFDTTTLANSGQYVNYQEGLIAIPLVIKVSSATAAGADDWFTHGAAVGGIVPPNPFDNTDFMIGFKNSHVQLINSISINLNNQDIVQAVPMTNAYLTFIQHSEMTQDDEFLNMPLTGYSKDSSASWYYNTAALTANTTILTGDSRGIGLGNNANFGLVDSFESNESYNIGFKNRQKLISKYNAEKQAVLGTLDKNAESLKSYAINTVTGKFIYYDCYLRLKDICPNLFNNLPMSLGLKLRITLTLNNNIEFQFQKMTNGSIVHDYSTFKNPTSATNPLMIASSYNTYQSQTGGDYQPIAAGGAAANVNTNLTGNYCFTLTNSAEKATIIPCGSSGLPCLDTRTYTVKMRIGGVDGSAGKRPQCILYVPSYILNPSPLYSSEYTSEANRFRKIHYTELEYQVISPAGTTQSFNYELSSSCLRPKRLIMIPILTSASNFGLNPISSPFTTEPATSSPCMITQFNCSIANINLYPNDITYSYDHYLQELNGSTGVNANLTNGLVSSRINLVDYQNNYCYIVCDLSRRTSDLDNEPVSVRVRGIVNSAKSVDIHCYIEREKWIKIDIMTGAIVDRQ